MIATFDNFTPVVAWVPGPWEIVVILLVLLLLFGGKKLPELARGLAKGIKGFKHELRDVSDAVSSDTDTDAAPDAEEKPKQDA